MNVIVIIAILAITFLVIFWLRSKICMHKYEIIDKQDNTLESERTYVSRCVKCGKICTKRVKLR